LRIIINEQTSPRHPVHVDGKMCSQSTFASPAFARRESEYIHRGNPVRGMKR
jgi:hypothetical protein